MDGDEQDQHRATVAAFDVALQGLPPCRGNAVADVAMQDREPQGQLWLMPTRTDCMRGHERARIAGGPS